jgi:hypothetical protein
MNDVEKTGKSLPKELESVDSSMADLGGMGTESVNQANVETPRLKILEAQSPQVMKGKDRLSDAEIGDFCKTDTGDLWRGEVTVIPCDFHTRYVEWPKARGKGAPIKDHGEDPSILRQCDTNEKNQHTLPNGNRVEETAFWYLLIKNGAEWQRVLFQLTSTRLKASRKWMTAIRAETLELDGKPWKPPLFWRAWTLRAADDKNDKGDWSTFVAERGDKLLDLDKSLIPLARAFCFDAQAENLRFKPEAHDGPTIEAKANKPLTGEQIIGEPLPH